MSLKFIQTWKISNPRLPLLAISCSIIFCFCKSASADINDTHLESAYQNAKNFSKTPFAAELNTATLKIIQPYSNPFPLRAWDTIGYRLKRMLDYANVKKTSSQDVKTLLIFDLISNKPHPALSFISKLKPSPFIICTFISKLKSEELQKSLEQYIASQHLPCTTTDKNLITIGSELNSYPYKRVFAPDGQPNEIGQRILSEKLLSILLKNDILPAKFMEFSVYKNRINIYPDKNERLASISGPD